MKKRREMDVRSVDEFAITTRARKRMKDLYGTNSLRKRKHYYWKEE